jgi:hypothetical protein
LGRICSTYGCGEVYKWFLLGNLRNRDDLEDPSIDSTIIVSWIFRKWDVKEWTG